MTGRLQPIRYHHSAPVPLTATIELANSIDPKIVQRTKEIVMAAARGPSDGARTLVSRWG